MNILISLEIKGKVTAHVQKKSLSKPDPTAWLS